MTSSRLKRVLGVMMAVGFSSACLEFSQVVRPPRPAKWTTTGTATGTIDDSGNIGATVDGQGAVVLSTTTLVGVLAKGSGIGSRTAKTKATSDSEATSAPPSLRKGR